MRLDGFPNYCCIAHHALISVMVSKFNSVKFVGVGRCDNVLDQIAAQRVHWVIWNRCWDRDYPTPENAGALYVERGTTPGGVIDSAVNWLNENIRAPPVGKPDGEGGTRTHKIVLA